MKHNRRQGIVDGLIAVGTLLGLFLVLYFTAILGMAALAGGSSLLGGVLLLAVVGFGVYTVAHMSSGPNAYSSVAVPVRVVNRDDDQVR